jgi:class 3 adenylate cyclase
MADYIALVFTDLVNSTAVKDAMPGNNTTDRNQSYRDNILFPHRKRVIESLSNYGGRVVEPPQGDGFLLEFPSPLKAVQWSLCIQCSHLKEPIKIPSGYLEVKIGIHYGAPLRDGDGFIGQEVDYAARVAALASGQQILLSKTMGVLIEDAKIKGINIHPYGQHLLKGIGIVPIFELIYDEFKKTSEPVDLTTFEELSLQLALDQEEIANLDFETQFPTKPQTLEILDIKTDTSPPYPNGAVPLGSPFYLERQPIEEQSKQEIRKPGSLMRIKAPKEMGKTSLLMRILQFARNQGYQTVSLNLDQADQAILNNLNQFLRWLCANVARQLHLKPKLDEYWDEDLGCKISCTSYFEDYLLKSIQTPLVLALDEANQLFEHSEVAKDFFPLLRSWYEEGKTSPLWQRLRLVIVHSTEIYVPLQLNQSPFNVGLTIQLNHFSQEEVKKLAQCYDLDWERGEDCQQLMEMVDGHPALVQIALYYLSREEMTLEHLLATSATNVGIYTHHLQRHWVTLQEQPKLTTALKRVMDATEAISLDDNILIHKLSSMGLIKHSGDKVMPRCELYRQSYLKK